MGLFVSSSLSQLERVAATYRKARLMSLQEIAKNLTEDELETIFEIKQQKKIKLKKVI